MENQNKYHNAKIYKITDIGYNKCYIGSTCEELSMRMARHRAHFKLFSSSKGKYTRACDIFNEYGIENCKIELIEYYKCNTLQELRRKEVEHIKNTECVNKRVEGRTDKEYYEENKNKILERLREYYENNQNKILERTREYNKANKEKQHEYYEINKEKIKERGTKKCFCECGKEYSAWGKSSHQKAIFHQNWLKENS